MASTGCVSDTMLAVGDVSDSAFSNKKREYPAWVLLLGGALFAGPGTWLVATGALDDSRRPLLPWFAIAIGLLTLGYGAREWVRNGSPTARRTKSAEERRRDAENNRRIMRWHIWQLVLIVVVVMGLLTVLLLER